MKLRGPKTRVIDLGGMTVIPGLIDAHGHVFGSGFQALSANILPPPDGESADIASLQRLLRDWAAKHQEAAEKFNVIVGFGYDDSQLKEQRHPTRDGLDQVSSTLPVVIVHQSGHLGVMNSKALEIVGFTAASKDPEGGAILKAGTELYAKYGYTTAQEGRATAGIIAIESAVAKQGGLKIDVAVYPDISAAADTIKAPLLSRIYTNHLRIAGAKLSLDGSPQGKTAWLTKLYFKVPPGQKADYLGYPTFTDEQVIA